MPHKQRMLSFVDELHPTARQVGAVNVIRCDEDGRWVGAIFDGLGCVLGMQWGGNDPANKSALLVGAGGAGRAIAFAVASAGARALTIFDVDERRADELAKSVTSATGCNTSSGSADPRGFEIVINATPLGMHANDPMPVNPERLIPGSIVVDTINAPAPTPLCRAADDAVVKGDHVCGVRLLIAKTRSRIRSPGPQKRCVPACSARGVRADRPPFCESRPAVKPTVAVPLITPVPPGLLVRLRASPLLSLPQPMRSCNCVHAALPAPPPSFRPWR